MTALYPEIEPYEQGTLAAGDGNILYWEACGSRDGKPAVVLHGGPGSGCSTRMRRYFDPSAYRVMLFDQRGCGRSRPHASDPRVDLASNTTDHLVEDVERLRAHLGVERWLVFGGSWGSTLGLAYAERYPERVTEMVLASVVTTSRREVRWVTRDAGRYFPEQWSRFRDGVPEADRDGDLAAAYARLLHDPDPAVRERAARDWCDWEDTHVAAGPDHRHDPRYDDPAFRTAFARLVTHYWRHAAWLEDGALLRDAGRLAGIPGVLVHGRRDLSGPVDVAWHLARAWPDAELVVVDEAGHGVGDDGMAEAVVGALDRFGLRIDSGGHELAEVVHRLTQEAFAAHVSLDPPTGATHETVESVRDELAREEAAIGWIGSRPAACMRLVAEGDHLYVRRLAVSPELQGRGLGRAMMTWAESAARRRGLSAVTVGVRLALAGNRAFFARLGYEPAGEHTHAGYDHPTSVEMRKWL
jgi:proline iminopeptidase